MNATIQNDIKAGFSVFLLALPLCLGIALASGCPAIAGIFTAIIGGIIGSIFGSAGATIKGPAAGMIVIVLGAVQELGQGDPELGYRLALAVGMVAALIQIGIALMKKAVIAEVMPPSVIHGMLAAIGIIIISKQIYVLIGSTPAPSKPLSLIYNFPLEMSKLHPLIFGIGVLSFLIAAFWPKIKKVSLIPSTIVILAVVIPISLFYNLSATAPAYLINLPINCFKGIQFPDFSQITTPTSIKYIIMFVLVGSLESLLTVCAVDSIQQKKEETDLNQDLKALGVANFASACLGGLPMISEIVRSKANIDYGGTTPVANFCHGLFMLLAVILFPNILNLIPLSALAALLIFVGLRLAAPREFKHVYEIGKDQFFLFLTTFLVTLETDLLIGVAAGILLKLVLFVIRGNSIKGLLFPIFTVEQQENQVVLVIDGPLTFVSYLKFKNIMKNLAKEHKKIVVSLKAVTYIDHTVMKKLHGLADLNKNIEISIEDNQQLVSLYNHPLSPRQLKC